MYDVAVVGAGPAGATLARLLAEEGQSVLLLERASLPRYKPCGGGLTARALRLLPGGALRQIRLRAPGADVFYGTHQVRVRTGSPAVGLVMRDAFDHRLVELAAAAGAEVQDGVAVRAARPVPGGVELEAGGHRVEARRLACADGSTGPFSGPMGAAVGLAAVPRRIGALEVEVEDAGGSWGPWLRGDFDLVPRGYGWVFPKAGLLSVGVASWGPAGGRLLRSALETYLRRLGLDRRPRIRTHGHPIPVGGELPAARLISGCALRLGDAAGLADPLFGEGIAQALESAHLAASALLTDDLAAYSRAVRRRIYRRFRVARVCAGVFYPWPAPWFQLVALWPRAGDRFFSLAVGAAGGGGDAPTL